MAEGLIVRRAPSRGFDFDAAAYIAAVEEADGQALEPEIRLAYNRFVLGCKDDGIWDAIKSSCIMAGARTLSGALVPLVGPAPTNFNFVSDDYDRILGLSDNGATKFIDTNRSSEQDDINDVHLSVWATERPSNFNGRFVSASSNLEILNGAGFSFRSRVNQSSLITHNETGSVPGMYGVSRLSQQNYQFVSLNADGTTSEASTTVSTSNYFVFRRNDPTPQFLDGRLSFYSVGSGIDLIALRNRVGILMNSLESALT